MQSQVKVVLLGESAVGKSSIVLRFAKNEFYPAKESTIGAAFLTQKCRLPEDPSRVIKFEIWDTAGQERFNSITPIYYRKAQAAIVVYDITKPSTFQRAKYWVDELKRDASPDLVIALAGNKVDLLSSIGENESVEYVATDFATEYSVNEGLLFYETSAKTGTNIIELFTDIARKMPLMDSRSVAIEGTSGDSRDNNNNSTDKMYPTELGKSPVVLEVENKGQDQNCGCSN